MLCLQKQLLDILIFTFTNNNWNTVRKKTVEYVRKSLNVVLGVIKEKPLSFIYYF